MTMDFGLIRYLTSDGDAFDPITICSEETESEAQFILDLKEEVLANGIGVVNRKYPLLSAFFGNIHKHESKVPIALFEILAQGLNVLKDAIAQADGNLEKVPEENLKAWRKPLAAIFYLIFKSYDTFRSLVLAENFDDPDTSRPVSARAKKLAHARPTSSTYAYWYDWQVKFLGLINQIVNQPLKKVLWENSDTNFLNFLVWSCSSIIRFAPNDVLDDENFFNTLLNVLGKLWKTHNMDAEIVKVFISAIKKSDESLKLTTYCAKGLADKHDVEYICLNILNKSFKGSQTHKFADSEKPLGAFITEMTELSCERMCVGLPILRNLLQVDSYVLRGSVLICMGTLLGWAKSDKYVALRAQLLKLVLTHLNDQNINVRARAVQVLTRLVDYKHLYLAEQIKALHLISRKINDKAASVRKAAIGFFRALGSGNPILTKFSMQEIQTKLKSHLENYFESMVSGAESDEVIIKYVVQKFVEEVKSNDYGFGGLQIPEEMNTPEKAVDYIGELIKGKLYWKACEATYIAMENYLNQPGTDQSQKEVPGAYFVLFKNYLELECDNELEIDLGAVGQSEKFKHDERRVIYYKEIKKLKAAFESSFPVFCRILEIGTANDRKDTINLFAVYSDDGFAPTKDLTNSIMTAFGKVDGKLASDLLDSFYRIFIPGETKSSKDIAEKLVTLVASMTIENKERMITLFQEMFRNTRNAKDCVKDLWCIYNDPDVERARAAVYLLGVKGSLDERFILEWIDPMLAVGFGQRGLDDYSLATATGSALLVMYEHCVTKEPDGLYEHHLLFEKIEQFIQHGFEYFEETSTDLDYCDFVDVAIRIVYYICNDPLVIINGIIHVMSQHVFPPNYKNNPITSEGRIHRYIALAEVIIECHIYFYEVIVVEEIKKRKAVIEQKKSQKKMGPPAAPKQTSVEGRKKQSGMRRLNASIANGSSSTGDLDTSRTSINRMSRRNASTFDTTDKTNEMEEMIGAGDREGERIRDYLDGILNEGLMSQIRLHVAALCTNIEQLSYNTQVSCIGLLTKVMCLNQQGMFVTMKHFMDLWNRTTCPYLTVELIKAGIYINMRFPNSTEESNKAIITGLKHENVKIRVATLDFIIYLCLSEVIKVREYLIASSICLNDVHEPIKIAAKDFFMKMAEKSNIVYNCLPEITTFLTAQKTISLLEYQTIMKYLLLKLKKPTQLYGLIETLVARFKKVNPGRERQDVAFCLSLLNYNDKTFRIIDEAFESYCDKLEDQIVYDSFAQIASNARKNCSKDYKITIEKYEANLQMWKENSDRREVQSKKISESISKNKNPSKNANRNTEEVEQQQATPTTQESSTQNNSEPGVIEQPQPSSHADSMEMDTTQPITTERPPSSRRTPRVKQRAVSSDEESPESDATTESDTTMSD